MSREQKAEVLISLDTTRQNFVPADSLLENALLQLSSEDRQSNVRES